MPNEPYHILPNRVRRRLLRPGARAAFASRHGGAGALAMVRRLKKRVLELEEENHELRSKGGGRESSFRQVIDASPVPLSVDDMKGKIEYLNDKFVEKFGYSRKELPTSAAWFARAYPDPEYRRQVAAQWQALLKSGLRRGKDMGPLEVEVTCKDGSLRRVDFVGTLLGKRLLIAANDLTDRERLEQQIVKISEEERERIGQDLHDGLCQLLSGIKFKTTLLEQKLETRHAPEAADAGAIEGLLNTAIKQARNIARGLHPVDLEARGLMFALQQLADTVATVYGIGCTCLFGRQVLVHDHIVATHLYRIAQEAINNAVRHGHANRITIRLAGGRRNFRMTVYDNGRGIPTRRKSRSGMGLHLMHYRAKAIGAHLEIRRGSSGGTLVTCWLPNPRLNPLNSTLHERQIRLAQTER